MVLNEASGERTANVLSRSRIVSQAIRILDDGGIGALTFRTLASALSTGPGGIYHHVANRAQLLELAASDLLRRAMDDLDGRHPPAADVRALMTGVFDAIVAHPWLGAQLAAAPWQPAVLHVFDRVGSGLAALGIPEPDRFDVASVLVHDLLGVAGQHAAASRLTLPPGTRADFLAAAIAASDPDASAGAYPFLARAATRLADHDDRAQFRNGVEIILAGARATTDRPRRGRLDAWPSSPC